MCVLKKYKDIEGTVKIEEVNGDELVKRFAEEMEEMLGRKMKAVKVIIMHAESKKPLMPIKWAIITSNTDTEKENL